MNQNFLHSSCSGHRSPIDLEIKDRSGRIPELLHRIFQLTILLLVASSMAACSAKKEIANTGIVEIHTLGIPFGPHVDLVEPKHKLYDKNTKTFVTSDIVYPDQIRLSPNQKRLAFVDFQAPSSYVIRVYDISTKTVHTVYDSGSAKDGHQPSGIRWVSDSVLGYSFFAFEKRDHVWRELELSW